MLESQLQYQSLSLTEDHLPYSDDQPVDNELQVLLPVLLRAILALLWAERQDWFFGINLGIYHTPLQPAIGPDAFLSLGVVRYKQERGHLSYVVMQENNIVPQWALEIVSQQPGGEYADKFEKYAEVGVLYYVIYNPNHWQRDQHEPFEVYRLEDRQYVRQSGNPVWMPELGLGIGTERGQHEGLEREWLYWYNETGQRHPAPENVIAQERQLRKQAEQIARTLIRRQLTHLIGDLPDSVLNPINRLSMTQLDALSEALWNFATMSDLIAWLQENQNDD